MTLFATCRSGITLALMARRFFFWLFDPQYRFLKTLLFLGLVLCAGYFAYLAVGFIRDLSDPRSGAFLSWGIGNKATRESLVVKLQEPCPGTPFILPAEGFIGLLYADPRGPYSSGNPHQGIDIFSYDRDMPGLVPVYTAYDGFVTREIGWRSTLIQRVPNDPLNPDTQIWLYYTHMADQDGNDLISSSFPPGTRELHVKQGTLLGYTGNYNGNSSRDIWVHLHFSIVKDDGSGHYTNELEFENTIDPSPYLGIPVNHTCPTNVLTCSHDLTCS